MRARRAEVTPENSEITSTEDWGEPQTAARLSLRLLLVVCDVLPEQVQPGATENTSVGLRSRPNHDVAFHIQFDIWTPGRATSPFVETSPTVENRPFLPLFANAQWLHGGELNFSFADHATGLVRYARPRVTPWTNGLEWFPGRVLNSDLRYFDYAFVNGTGEALASLNQEPALEPVTATSPWRLYQVRR